MVWRVAAWVPTSQTVRVLPAPACQQQAAATEVCEYSPCRPRKLCHQCNGLPEECHCWGLPEPLWVPCADCGVAGPCFCGSQDDLDAAESNLLDTKEQPGREIESVEVQELTEEDAPSTKMVAAAGAAVVAVATAGAAATAIVGDFARSLSCPSLIEQGAARPTTAELDTIASARQAEENDEADPNMASSQRLAAATSAVAGLADDPLRFWGPIGLRANEPCTLPAAKVPLHVGGDASLSEAAAQLIAETTAHACSEVQAGSLLAQLSEAQSATHANIVQGKLLEQALEEAERHAVAASQPASPRGGTGTGVGRRICVPQNPTPSPCWRS